MYSCFVHLLYLDRLSWANVIKWKGSLRSPSLFTPDLIVVVLSIYIRRELNLKFGDFKGSHVSAPRHENQRLS